MKAMFVNLPVTDLDRAKRFYEAIGFTANPLITDHNSACIVVEEDHSYPGEPVDEFAHARHSLQASRENFFDRRDGVDAEPELGRVLLRHPASG